MTNYKVGPTGQLLQGHLYDVNKHSLMRMLNDYDSQLYLKWNPFKRKGLGCWELRRKPDTKLAVYHGELDGHDLYSLEAIENDMIAHVLDIPFLSYQVLDKLKEMDAWNDKNWIGNLEGAEREAQDRVRSSIKKELRYNLKQHRNVFRVFKDMVASGVNPALIAKYWK